MKNKGALIFLVALAVLVGGAYFPFNQDDSQKEAILMQTIMQGLEQLHYQPAAINDDFSAKAFDLYLDRIDLGRRWLTQEDIALLKPFENSIDDQLEEGTFQLLDVAIERIEAGLNKTQAYYQEFLSQPFDYSVKESVELGNEDKAFAKDDTQLKEYWRKAMKYETLNKVYNKQKSQNDKIEKGEEVEKKTFAEMEEKAREEVLKTFNDWYDRMSKDRRSDYLSDYINALTNIYDPHTSYLLPKDKANFDINMSGTLEGIGARLQTDGDYTKVSEIIPGGPAWKGKELEANDLITKVAQDGEEPLDVTGFRIDDVVKNIRGKKGTIVNLTVKKVDGTEQVISITRDVVEIDEGYAKSAIVNLEGAANNIGYIHLPRFYADFQRTGGRSCAEDVAKEVEKLKENNVGGIILDLRSNGGGSLRDVVKMTGLFIEEGPIVQVKTRYQSPDVLSDTDPEVQYDGKLIVLVNSFSASASEILAAALQDYGRALIIGTGKTTFGKGTVQRFFDLDRAIRGYNEIKPLGDVKLTIQKFYRVDGGSTQLKGVKPDIILPDRFFYLKLGEQDQEYPMSWSEIEPVDHDQKVYRVNGLDLLSKSSFGRIANHPTFKLVKDDAARLKAQRDETQFAIDLDTYSAERKEREAIAKEFEDIFTPVDGLKVTNLDSDMAAIKIDEAKQARNDDWLENLHKDIYLEEAMRIMSEMK